MDEHFWPRIRMMAIGFGHISFGASTIANAFTNPDQTVWSLSKLTLGGLIFIQGMKYLGAAQELRPERQARRQARPAPPPPEVPPPPPPEAPPQVANGHARVGIPLAPAERDDPELAIEGLLLHHDLARIWVSLRNLIAVVQNPPVAANDEDRMDIQLAPVEQGDPELAMGLGLNDPPQELNRDVVGIEQVEVNDALQVQAVEGNGAVRVGIRLAPLEQGDPELAMDPVLNDPPQVLNRDMVGIEQVEVIDALQVQAIEENGAIRVGIHLAPVEQGDQERAMLGFALHVPEMGLDRAEEADVEQVACNDAGQAQTAANARVGIRLGTDGIGDSTLVAGGLLRQAPSKIQVSALKVNEYEVDPLKSEQGQDPQMEEMLGLVLHEPPLALDRIDEGSVKQGGCKDERRVQVKMMEEQVPLTEELALQVEGLALLRVEQEPLVDEQAPLTDEQAPLTDEQAPLTDEQAPLTDEQATLVDEKKDQFVGMQFVAERGVKNISSLVCLPQDDAPLRDASKDDQFYEGGQKESLDGAEQVRLLDATVPKVLLEKPVHLRSLNDAVQEDSLNESFPDVLLDETMQPNLLKQPLLTPKLEESVSTRLMDKPVQDATDKPVQDATDKPVQDVADKPVQDVADKPVQDVADKPVQDVADKPVQDVADKPVQNVADKPVQDVADKPVQAELLGETAQAELLDEAVQAELLDEAVQARLLDEPVPAELLDEAVQARLLDEPVPAELLYEAVQVKLLDDPVYNERLHELMQDEQQD